MAVSFFPVAFTVVINYQLLCIDYKYHLSVS